MKRPYTENRRKTNQQWYLKNKEKAYESAAQWRKANPERVKAAQQRYRDKNPHKKRDERLKREFGMSFIQYQEMLNHQNGVCAICSNPETRIVARSGKISELAVDHCHRTGKIRGLLCAKCNTAIGLLNEDINIINNCVNYLMKESK